MRVNKGTAMTADELGEDPWAAVHGGGVSRKSPVSDVQYLYNLLCSGVVGLGSCYMRRDD